MQPDRAVMDQGASHIALVVDDDPGSLGVVVSALEDCGMTVLVARDGGTAIDLTDRVQPDVILLDAMMPGPDGFETCRRLKTRPNPTPAPVIFMTGLTQPENIVRGLRAGAVDYLTKPLVIEELIARMTIHIMNAKLIQSAHAALDLAGPALLAFDNRGSLAWGTPRALSGGGLAPDLAGRADFGAWLASARMRPLSTVPPFEIGGTTLQVVGLSTGGELLVKMVPKQQSTREERLASAFGLTKREAEVLFWLSLGKTNRDIGTILSLSARTVNKHLEAIFQRMGVDNRTSAAVMADRVLNSETL